jgi:DNA helicase-2/ATP-dependent DNA helicase PcrA
MPKVTKAGMVVNDQQDAIIQHVLSNKVTVVSAGAGTGKTYTTVATVLELVELRKASLDQFILITFTRKAASELRERLEKAVAVRLAGAGPDRQYWLEQQERLASAFIGTIHGFCQQMLRTYGYSERVAREYRVSGARGPFSDALQDAVEACVNQDSVRLLGDEYLWHEHDLRKLLSAIVEQMRNRGVDPVKVLAATAKQATDAGYEHRLRAARLVADVADRYGAKKAADQKVDTNDLLGLTAGLLLGAEGDTIRDKVTDRYRHLFVDEFQDTDPVQKEILDRVLPKLAGLMVVGDRKQSIYGWRSAVEKLLKQIADENGIQPLPLSGARRPTRALLDVQNTLFGNVDPAFGLNDPLQPYDGMPKPEEGPPPFRYVSAGGEATMEQRIGVTVEEIRRVIGEKIYDVNKKTVRRIGYGDIAVLTRSNRVLRAYADGMRRAGIPVREESGGLFWQRPEIVSTYRMLLLVLNYPDDTALSLAFGTDYFRGVDAAPFEQMMIQYQMQGDHPLTDWTRTNHARLMDKIAELQVAVRKDTVPQLIARLYEAFKIREVYLHRGDRQKAENLEKLREMARTLFNNEQALTLRQFVNYMETMCLTGQEEEEADVGDEPSVGEAGGLETAVRVMTIHRAKGLEFPIVIIPEVQAPLLPKDPPAFLFDETKGLEVSLPVVGVDTLSGQFGGMVDEYERAQVEEALRVFYVGVTRAQNMVICVGSGFAKANAPFTQYYAWKDEILRARSRLTGLGAQFV